MIISLIQFSIPLLRTLWPYWTSSRLRPSSWYGLPCQGYSRYPWYDWKSFACTPWSFPQCGRHRELTDVIKPIAGNFVHALRRVIRIFFVFGYDISLCLCQSALKATYDRHRDNDITIYPAYRCHAAYWQCSRWNWFFADIYRIIIPKYIDLLLMSHLKSSYTHMQAILLDSLYMQNF